MENADLNWAEATQLVSKRFECHAPKALFSNVIIEQVAECERDYDHPFSPIRIYHAIERCEQSGCKVRGFREGGSLGGLLHIHHHQSAFMDWNRDKAIQAMAKQQGLESLEYLYSRRAKYYQDRIEVHDSHEKAFRESLNMIAHDVIKRIEKHFGGEWIIFAKDGEQHLYLCLATHKEGKEDVTSIQGRCRQGFNEFPNFSGRPSWSF